MSRGKEEIMFHRPQAQKEAEKKQPNIAGKNTAQQATRVPSQNWTGNAENANSNTANLNTEGNATMTDNTRENTVKTADIPATPNTGFNTARPNYSGGAAQYPNYSTQTAARTDIDGRQLVIGEGITMSGEIAACDHLVVEGHVEASLNGAKVLEVAETGSFNGSVEIEEATIAGKFSGEVIVSGRLTVKASGKITGTISYGELAVEAGAVLKGKLGPVTETKTATVTTTKKETKSDKSAPTKTAKKKSTASNDQQDGGELPFAATAAE